MDELIRELNSLSNEKLAGNAKRFFKTGIGEYGEGDKFLGIRGPDLHKLARKYTKLKLQEITLLLTSPFHEVRMLSLFILVLRYEKSKESEKREIIDIYLSNTRYINNWDLVDSSAYKILGDYLLDKNRSILHELALSKEIWERRISIVATFKFIKKGCFGETIRISELLLRDREDLIHKAAGWMLRELGKRNVCLAMDFLDKYSREMPRTMLRYAIEKFPESLRQEYLSGKRARSSDEQAV